MWFRQSKDKKLRTTTKNFTWNFYGANFDNYIIWITLFNQNDEHFSTKLLKQ
jgi:hypothetical protein